MEKTNLRQKYCLEAAIYDTSIQKDGYIKLRKKEPDKCLLAKENECSAMTWRKNS